MTQHLLKLVSPLATLPVLFATCLLLSFTSSLAEMPALNAEIVSVAKTVEVYEVFKVDAAVVNTGNKPLELTPSHVFFFNWEVDRPEIALVQYDVEKNGWKKIQLKPGEKYREEVYLYPRKIDGLGKITFRLGFLNEAPGSEIKAITWSNPLEIEVKKSSLAVELSTDAKTVKAGDTFKLRANVINVSTNRIELEDWDKSPGSQWKCNHGSIDVPLAFSGDSPEVHPLKISLEPGKFFDIGRTATLSKSAEGEDHVTFSLGYIAIPWTTGAPVQDRGENFMKFSIDHVAHWSNPVTLKIDRGR